MTESKKFAADVLFLDPANVAPAVAALASFGFHFKSNPDAVDPCGPTVFGMLRGTTTLSEDDLGDQLLRIIDPFGGDVIEWGFETD
jgi:hypothetical protein